MDFEQLDLFGAGIPEKEKKILMAAIRIFSEKGFSAATTSEIAKTAGVAEGTIFRYFKTKKDILRGILVRALSLVSRRIIMDPVQKIMQQPDKDLRAILRELLYDRLKLAENFFPIARVVLTEAMYHEDVREAIFNNIILKAKEIFDSFYQAMVEKGIVRSDIDSLVILRSALANIAILIAQHMMFSDRLPIQDLDMEFDKVFDVLMNGIAVKNPEPDKPGNVNGGAPSC